MQNFKNVITKIKYAIKNFSIKKYKLSLQNLERALLATLLILAIFLASSIAYIILSLDSLTEIEKLDYFRNKIPTRVYDIHGKQFAEFFYQKREITAFDKIPKHLINAIIAMEDNSFYSHSGIDLWGMTRAFFVDVFAGSFKQGGSTITQQLAKRLFTRSEKTIFRKLKEIWYAVQIEKKYSKNEILERYFNEIYFGHGAYGIEAASQLYFNKSASKINLAECAMLAALPSAPSRFSPIAFPNNARKRQRLVLLKMVQLKYITKKQADKAYENFWDEFSQKDLNPNLSAWNSKVDSAPYFTEYIRQQLIKIYGKDKVNEDGLRVYTTLDMNMQNAAKKALNKKLYVLRTNYQTTYDKYMSTIRRKYIDPMDLITTIFGIQTIKLGGIKTTAFVNKIIEKTYKAPLLMLSMMFGLKTQSKMLDISYNYNPKSSRDIKPEGALVAIEPGTGYVKTIVGGSKFTPDNRFNRAIQAYRQPGSAFKPFVYLAAIQSKILTAGTALDDSPVAFHMANGQLWLPRNYDRHFYGKIILRDALRWSVNIISIKVLDIIGFERITKVAAALLHINPKDIEKRFKRAFSLALGGSEVTPFEMATAFAIMANQGKDIRPISILRVYDRDGKLLDDFLRKRDYDRNGKKIKTKQLIDKASIYIITSMMEGVVKQGGTAWEAKYDAKLTRRMAGKTGTTSNWKDLWFAGFTPRLAAAAWMGFDDPAYSLGRSASAAYFAAPVVMEFMKDAIGHTKPLWFPVPRGIFRGMVCRRSGKKPSKDCKKPTIYSEYFLQGSGLPKGKCKECREVHSDITNRSYFKVNNKKNTTDQKKKNSSFLKITGKKFNADDLFND
ncbi:MAG: PBP1A family penicillin-binding protein [Spirochaetes bacterium]|nr:PBP1A family penicillin-binding protein [Spirochaetota bacterium]